MNPTGPHPAAPARAFGLGLLAALAGSITTPLAAQTAAPAVPSAPAEAASASAALPAVRVTGPGETAAGAVPGYTARRSSSATRTDTPLDEVPQSVSVIGAEQVRDQNSTTMQEVLRYTAGVRAELYGLDNRGDYFALRGGSEGSTLLDGLRLPLTGFWGIVRNEPYAFERIEVLRGPSSLMAGQNGPGGVVNLVSKRPTSDTQREIQVQLGTDEHRQIAADLGGPLLDDGRLDYRLVALRRDSGTQVHHAGVERSLLAPSVTWKPQAGTTLTAHAEVQKDRSQNLNGFFPVAGTLNEAPNGRIPLDTFIGEPDWDTYGGTRKRYGWALEQRIADGWTLRHRLRRDSVDGHLATAYAAWWLGYADATGAADPDGRYLNRIAYAADERSRITNGDLLVEGRVELGRTRHTLLFGADALSHRMQRSDYGSYAITPLDVYDPVYGTAPFPTLDPAQFTYSDSQVRSLGLVLQDQIRIDDHWVVVAGLRHDRAKTDGQKDVANSRNLGLVYLADGGWSPYVGYSESFEPTVGRLAPARGGGAFEPRRGRQLEAGVKWMPEGSRIAVSAAAYRLEETNRLVGDPQNVNFSVQAGEATVDGVEIDASATLADWQVLGNASFTRARLTGPLDAGRGEQLSGIPRLAAAAWAVYRFGAFDLPGLRVGGGVRHAGPTWDGNGTNRVPSNTLLDLLVGLDSGPWTFALNVNNLTDRRYVATCLARGDCWFGTTRRAVVTAGYRW